MQYECKLDRIHVYVNRELKKVEEGSEEEERLKMINHVLTGGKLPEEW